MNFFEQQAAAHRRATRLLVLFALSVTVFLALLGALPFLLISACRAPKE